MNNFSFKKCLSIVALVLAITLNVDAQDWTLTPLADLPEPVSNNAVVAGVVNGKTYVYSFAGIDSTKLYSGIHNRSWRYDVALDLWENLPDLPDPMSKIAAGASIIDGIAYIMGGYHVFSNGSEVTSDKVHRLDLATNTFLEDGAPIPVPTDDHVQAVWQDSLIYLVTGWTGTTSGGTNIRNVQIYDPSLDTWQEGTALPNLIAYKVFGASGSIIGNTIYYLGGAKIFGSSFLPSTEFRIGTINPLNPSEVTWEFEDVDINAYRSASTVIDDNVYFLGGSDVTYNFNGIAYNGSGGVNPNLSSTAFHPDIDSIFRRGPFENMPMDLRGIGEISINQRILAGGMEADQKVSKKTWLLDFVPVEITSTVEKESNANIKLSPNPANTIVEIENVNKEKLQFSIISIDGKKVYDGELQQFEKKQIDCANWQSGNYQVFIYDGTKMVSIESLIKI